MPKLEYLPYAGGRFHFPRAADAGTRAGWIQILAQFPMHLRAAVLGLDRENLDTPIQSNGQTIRHLIHHLADTHLNGFLQFKMARFGGHPANSDRDTDDWVDTPDYQVPISYSMQILRGLHHRWAQLLRNLGEEEWSCTMPHPGHSEPVRLDSALAFYAWHCNHYLGKITSWRRHNDC